MSELSVTVPVSFEGSDRPWMSAADEPLSACVRRALDGYFAQLSGHDATNLYDMVLEEIERPMFETVLRHTRGNQVKAARLLGISRSTLRKKLAVYELD